MQAACVGGKVKRADLIIAARTSGSGVIQCLKKFLAGTNKH
jgi:hypothetical protein